MFKLNNDFTEQDLSSAINHAERNYVIQVNDLLSLDVFTNDGERIVDPNNELQEGMQRMQGKPTFQYLVKTDGTVKFPIVGQVKIDSLTLDQAESILQKKYDDFYKQSFVKLQFANKRVVVLGATVAGGQIIPLTNENVSLVEVLAMAGGLDINSKAQNIKVIRGNLSDPEVYQINLSTVSGMKQSMLDIEPGDIIYIEPWKRPFFDATKDITPILSLLSSTLALVLVLQNL
ncbi:polysaccharide biosynthesis/export family protein [Reichenbachiella carrageenanivorans]|uniref:Polysaccharide biosynthesis/export family protein n=1 Tax=Reichenbachiella carrageenanivorans TaxID=2979869 RepID=A0ABY6D234_9BACT|nr:polysaccharide biosynthesis/export family protein [Reichenbachiella carrageenanivorans]UXX80222.1 polysaccharide biosynthesis/export family protein [Reichenbachiella carrageenanivorans]